MKFGELYNLINEDFDDSDSNIELILKSLEKHSNEKIAFLDGPAIIKTTEYTQTPQLFTFNKPVGFWYALGDAWGQYIKKFDKERYKDYHYIASLDIDYKNILKIDSSQKFEDFNNKYSEKAFFGRAINWKKVAEDYKGIEIIPYRPDYKHTYMWYNMWDLASGCIWDLSAIKNYKIIYNE